MLSSIGSGNTVQLRFRLRAGGATTTLAGGALTTNAWTHVAATYDGADMRLYIDGKEVAKAAKTGNLDTDNKVAVWIGDQPPAGGGPFDGLIDDVRLFARALSQ